MNVVFLGATSGMGKALARKMAARGDHLFLLGRDADALQATAADLGVRAGSHGLPQHAPCDLADPHSFAPALDAAAAALGAIDCVVVTAGMFATQDDLARDTDLAQRLLVINLANTIAFCEHARKRLLNNPGASGGRLCVFSSVAGDRGRKPVAIYGASKAGLSHYLESLDHTFHSQGLRVTCVKPGFVRTAMTEGLKPPPFAGEPDAVADIVLRAIDRGTPLVYAPPIWLLIMRIIQALPRAIMRRINF